MYTSTTFDCKKDNCQQQHKIKHLFLMMQQLHITSNTFKQYHNTITKTGQHKKAHL